MFQKCILIGVGAIALITSWLALHYRNQAVVLEDKYGALKGQLEQARAMADEPSLDLPEEYVQRPVPRPEGASRHPTEPVAPAREPIPAANPIARTPPENPSPDNTRRRGVNGLGTAWTNNSARHEDYQKHRQEMQQQSQAAWAQSANYFMNRDTSRMTRSEVDEYSRMIAALDKAAALNQKLQSGLPMDERQQLSGELRSNVVAVLPLLENERNREYYDAALALGQSEQDAAAMVNAINQITSNTSLRVILPGVSPNGRRAHGGHGG